MKNLIMAIVATAIFLTACNSNPKDSSSSTEDQGKYYEEMYSCSMHPDVTGRKGDKCSKCGMDLTVPVKKMDNMNHYDSSNAK